MNAQDQAKFNSLQNLLAIVIGCEPVLVDDPAAGQSFWMTRVTYAHAAGIHISLTMSPANARALARQMLETCGDCETRVVPAKKSPPLVSLR